MVLPIILVGAAAFAAGGAAVVAVAGMLSDDEGEEQRNEAVTREKARHAKREDALKKELEEYASKIREREDFFEAVLALAAIGFAAANCDGMVTKGQNEVIRQFVAGICCQKLPKEVIARMDEWYENPPNLRTACAIAEKYRTPVNLMDEVINVVILDGGPVNADKSAFLIAWRKLKAA